MVRNSFDTSDRHVGIRSCTTCGLRSLKSQLLRIVRPPRGPIVFDRDGKTNGRGAYLCKNANCWNQAISKGRIETVFKRPLETEERAMLLRSLETHINATSS